MTIENPPRLWAFAVRGAIHAAPEEAPLLASVHQGWGAAKPQAYVREDDANAEIAEARQARDEEGDLRREIEADRDAVRRERDALQRRVDALREGLRVIVMRSLASVDDPSVEVMAYEIANHALMLDSDMMADSDEAAAGKGVG